MYEVILGRRAQKDLVKFEDALCQRVLKALATLADNPRPADSIKLKRGEGGYRVRVGDYRVTNDIDDMSCTVVVLAVRHRSEVYKRL